jgi:hypothetical protein
MSDDVELIESMNKLACMMSFEAKDVAKLVRKVFVVSFRYVSMVDLWSLQFEGDYVDWSKRGVYRLESMPFWLSLLKLCSWEGLTQKESGIKMSQPILYATRQNLREVGMDVAGNWNLTCRILLLQYIQNIPTLHSIGLLTCGELRKDTNQACMQYLAKNADTPYERGEVEFALDFILKEMVVEDRKLAYALVCFNGG